MGVNGCGRITMFPRNSDDRERGRTRERKGAFVRQGTCDCGHIFSLSEVLHLCLCLSVVSVGSCISLVCCALFKTEVLSWWGCVGLSTMKRKEKQETIRRSTWRVATTSRSDAHAYDRYVAVIEALAVSSTM